MRSVSLFRRTHCTIATQGNLGLWSNPALSNVLSSPFIFIFKMILFSIFVAIVGSEAEPPPDLRALATENSSGMPLAKEIPSRFCICASVLFCLFATTKNLQMYSYRSVFTLPFVFRLPVLAASQRDGGSGHLFRLRKSNCCFLAQVRRTRKFNTSDFTSVLSCIITRLAFRAFYQIFRGKDL